MRKVLTMFRLLKNCVCLASMVGGLSAISTAVAVAEAPPTVNPADALKRLPESGGAGRELRFDAGLLFLGEPLEIADEKLSGLKIVGAADGSTILSGGRIIAGFTVDNEGRWKTVIPEVKKGDWTFAELFVGGRRATRARFPNSGYLRVEKSGKDRRTHFTFAEGAIPALDDVESLELVFLHDWSISRVRVKSLDPATRTLTTETNIGPKAPHYAIDHYEPHPRYFLENHRSFVDEPGEWFLDEQTGELTYFPLPGQTPESAQVIAPRLSSLLTVTGQEGAPVTDIVIENITFAHCAYDYTTRYAAGQAVFHEDDRIDGHGLRVPTPAAVTFNLAENCKLVNCRVLSVGGSGVWIRRSCRKMEVVDCAFADIGGNGLMIGEDRSRLVNGRCWCDAAPKQATTEILVKDCTIERVGERFFGAVGLWVGMANKIHILENTVRHTPYTGISLGWMWNPAPTPCGQITVERNHIHDNMQILSDGGGIYTLGRQPGTVIRDNVIHGIAKNAGRAESNGIFFDQGTTELLVEKNTMFDTDRSPTRWHQCGVNVMRNNTFVLKEGVPLVRYNNTPEKNVELEDNRVIPAGEWTEEMAERAIESVQ